MSGLSNIRNFEALRAVLTTGTTTGAAHSLGISQSSVSRAIAQLESNTGQILFDREGTRLAPTAAALKLNEELDDLFQCLRRIEKREWLSSPEEQLRIAATPTLAHHFLIRQIAEFHRLHPGQRILLDVRGERSIWDEMLEGRFDLCLTTIDLRHAGLKFTHLRDSEAVCIMPSGHPLEAKETVTINDLGDHDLIALSRRLDVRIKLNQLLANAGVTPRITLEVSTSEAACGLVKAGLGVSIINPFPLLAQPRSGISVRPFRPRIGYHTSFVTADSRPTAGIVRKFMKFVTNNIGR